MADDLDFEVCKDFYITVEAWDSGSPPLSTATMVIIELMDVNDNAPVFDQDMYNVLISEDAAVGQTVTRVRFSRSFILNTPVCYVFVSFLEQSFIMDVCYKGVCRGS